MDAAEALGFQRFSDGSGRLMEATGGCALVDETVRNGARQSIFRAYVYPLMAQPNLTVLTGALATRILCQRGRATGQQQGGSQRYSRRSLHGTIVPDARPSPMPSVSLPTRRGR